MTIVYIFLFLVVGYCLFQSVRFRLATWGERTRVPDIGKMASGLTLGRKHAVEDSFLTDEGRRLMYNHRVYDAVGVLAAVTLILLWMNENGLLDALLAQVERAGP